jgi:UDPglucose 6-dehydrogenase
MNLCVYGLWHLGTVTAACLASLGHNIIGLDDEKKKCKKIIIRKSFYI